MRHRDNQTGSALLAWADRQLPVLNTLVEFCHGSIKGLIYFFSTFWLFLQWGRDRQPFLVLCFLGRWVFLRMQGEICGDTWSTGFSGARLTQELQANRGGREQILGQCSACAVDLVCVFASFVGGCCPAKAMVHCAGCERPILDRFLLNVLDRAWHVKCVQCCECKCNLTEKCFSREGRLYCKNDFFR